MAAKYGDCFQSAFRKLIFVACDADCDQRTWIEWKKTIYSVGNMINTNITHDVAKCSKVASRTPLALVLGILWLNVVSKESIIMMTRWRSKAKRHLHARLKAVAVCGGAMPTEEIRFPNTTSMAVYAIHMTRLDSSWLKQSPWNSHTPWSATALPSVCGKRITS